MDFEFKEKYDIKDLINITEILRSENGCPWDKEQDHASIRMDVLEEAYEVMEAIDANSPEMLKEELGDLLFQAVFHCQIEREQGRFDFDDICNDVAQKMVYRHPHVFGTVSLDTSEDVLKNWDKLKKKSKNQDTITETFESVPKVFPALMRGQKIAKRAMNAGYNFDTAEERLEVISEKLDSLKLDIINKLDAEIEDDFGDILFEMCILSRFIKKDSEKALTFSINKFIMQFREFERLAKESGKSIEELTLEEQITLMKKAKDSLIG